MCNNFFCPSESSGRPVPSFRCTCYRSGEELHSFGSMDVAKSFGGALHVRHVHYHLNVGSDGTLAWAPSEKGTPKLSKFCQFVLASGVSFKKNLLNSDW